MSAEDIAMYEEYLEEQDYEAELEAMAEIELEEQQKTAKPNEAISKTSAPLSDKDRINIEEKSDPPTIPEVSNQTFTFPDGDSEDELVIDEFKEITQKRKISQTASPELPKIKRKRSELKKTKVLRVPPLECSSLRVTSEGTKNVLYDS